MTQSFDRDTLRLFDETAEIDIETSRGAGAPVHRATIWIVVDGDAAYVRSVRGPAGRWYRELLANPRGAVHAGGATVPVQAYPSTDSATVARVSDALIRKYQARWPGPTASMLRDEVLPTTLRLEPRST
ncbi:MAG: DUF2255 family protein [Chloroflexota bacterium]|nr:DUF2255 family protein [Chloroflexota bacterium]